MELEALSAKRPLKLETRLSVCEEKEGDVKDGCGDGGKKLALAFC